MHKQARGITIDRTDCVVHQLHIQSTNTYNYN